MGFHRYFEVGQRVVVGGEPELSGLNGKHGQVVRITGAGTFVRMDGEDRPRRIAWWRLESER